MTGLGLFDDACIYIFFSVLTRIVPALKNTFPIWKSSSKNLMMREFRLFVRIDTQLFWHYIISQLPRQKKIWEGNNISDNGKILIILQLLLCAYDYQNISESAMNDIFSGT